MYSRDELDDIHFDCENCGEEVISIKTKDDTEFRWVHGHLTPTPIFDL